MDKIHIFCVLVLVLSGCGYYKIVVDNRHDPMVERPKLRGVYHIAELKFESGLPTREADDFCRRLKTKIESNHPDVFKPSGQKISVEVSCHKPKNDYTWDVMYGVVSLFYTLGTIPFCYSDEYRCFVRLKTEMEQPESSCLACAYSKQKSYRTSSIIPMALLFPYVCTPSGVQCAKGCFLLDVWDDEKEDEVSLDAMIISEGLVSKLVEYERNLKLDVRRLPF